jgi:hypothetical protein
MCLLPKFERSRPIGLANSRCGIYSDWSRTNLTARCFTRLIGGEIFYRDAGGRTPGC